MQTFLTRSVHHDVILGTLSTFDRLIFKGHLSGLYPQRAFARYLNSQHVWLLAQPLVLLTAGTLFIRASEQIAKRRGMLARY